ncbi:MAG TPA: hypothetical protein VFH38_08815 [Jatrophihabitans sp.]|nr:hypothetical protein [Jatrophihabitans sp.]
MTRYWRVGTELVVWAGLCFGIWLLTLSSVTSEDILLAALAAALAAVCAVAGRKVAGGRWRGRLAWTRWYLGLPVAILLDTVKVLALVYSARRHYGRMQTLDLPEGEDHDLAAGRCAIGALGMSASPATYVVDADPDEHKMIVHTVGSPAPEWAKTDPSEE